VYKEPAGIRGSIEAHHEQSERKRQYKCILNWARPELARRAGHVFSGADDDSLRTAESVSMFPFPLSLSTAGPRAYSVATQRETGEGGWTTCEVGQLVWLDSEKERID
jgi:hypothetical protein